MRSRSFIKMSLSLAIGFQIYGATLTAQMGTPIKPMTYTPPASMKPTTTGVPAKHGETSPKPTSPPKEITPKVLEKKELASSQIYASPGIASLQGGQWVGRDHLFNLSSEIGVYLQIVQPSQPLAINEMAIKEKIVAVLQKGGVQPRTDLLGENNTPLPFLHFIVVLNSQDKDILIAFCACRLFEAIHLDRIRLDTGVAWQAITWEQQELLVIPPAEVQDSLTKELSEFASFFADRFAFYQLLKAGTPK